MSDEADELHINEIQSFGRKTRWWDVTAPFANAATDTFALGCVRWDFDRKQYAFIPRKDARLTADRLAKLAVFCRQATEQQEKLHA